MPGRFACYHPPPSRHRIPIATSGSPCRTPRWDTARHDQRFDSLVCPAEHLSRHSPRSVGPVEHALLLVDLHGILVGDVSVGGEFRSGGGRLWSRADVLVRFRNLYRFLPLDLDTGLHLALLAPALCFLAGSSRGSAARHCSTRRLRCATKSRKGTRRVATSRWSKPAPVLRVSSSRVHQRPRRARGADATRRVAVVRRSGADRARRG